MNIWTGKESIVVQRIAANLLSAGLEESRPSMVRICHVLKKDVDESISKSSTRNA